MGHAMGRMVVTAERAGRERGDLALAWVATLVFFGGFYSLLVPLPRYLAAIGLPDWQIGLILGAFGVASLLGRSLAGVGVDRWGSRAMLLVGSAALAVGAWGVSLTASPAMLLLLRLAQAAGYVLFTTAGTALVVRLTPVERRSGRLALFGAAANVAIVVAPAVAGVLLEAAPLASGFWLTGGLAVVAGALALRLGRDAPGEASSSGPWWLAWRLPRVLWPAAAVTGLFGMGFAAFFLYAAILGDRRGVPAGLLYGVYGVGIILTRVTLGRWLDRIGARAGLAAAAVLTTAGLAACGAAADAVLLSAGAVSVAVGGGMWHPILIALHARLLPDAPGRATAAFYLAFDLGIGAGGWLLGAVLDLGGLGWLFGVGAGLTLLTLPLIPRLDRPPPSEAAMPAPRPI
jgi:MFS family permease